MNKSSLVVIFLGGLLLFTFNGCAELADSILMVDELRDKSEFRGRVDDTEKLPNGNMKVTFSNKRIYEIYKWDSFLKGTFVRIYKDDNGFFLKNYTPRRDLVSQGELERIEFKQSTTIVHIKGGVSYEVYGSPQLSPGQSVSVYKVEGEYEIE